MGYGGFARFRIIVAENVSEIVGEHYNNLFNAPIFDREDFFKKYDAKTNKLIGKDLTIEVANFLFQSDCEGKIDRRQSNQIYRLIKNCNDDTIFGYQGRQDCAKMADIKKIFSDKTKVEWC